MLFLRRKLRPKVVKFIPKVIFQKLYNDFFQSMMTSKGWKLILLNFDPKYRVWTSFNWKLFSRFIFIYILKFQFQNCHFPDWQETGTRTFRSRISFYLISTCLMARLLMTILLLISLFILQHLIIKRDSLLFMSHERRGGGILVIGFTAFLLLRLLFQSLSGVFLRDCPSDFLFKTSQE